MRYKINSSGNTILADQAFMEANYPGDYTQLPDDPVIAEPASRVMSVLDFRSLFTLDEKRAIYTAAKTEIDVQIWLDDLSAAQEVHKDDPRILNGLQGLETAGLIATGWTLEKLS